MFRYQYDEGQYVFKEGAHGGYLCFIVEGEDLGIANRVMMGMAGLLSGSLRKTTQAFSEQTLSLANMLKPTKQEVAFGFFTEIGIINQLASNAFEKDCRWA